VHFVTLNPSYLKEWKMLTKDLNIDVAMKHFRLACDYMDVHRDIHPSHETVGMLAIMITCLQAFCSHDEVN
jgi:hypothetical protein